MEGKILAINTGSTSTKIAFFDAGELLFEQNVTLDPAIAAKHSTSVMALEIPTRDAITDFLVSRNIDVGSIDLIMARGGLITPIKTGVYGVNQAMRNALYAGKEGAHACNLSAIIADDIALMVNSIRASRGLPETCRAYIADPPMADEMLPELKLGGRPEFPRRTLFHALNSRAMVRRYAAGEGKLASEVTAIVAHMGGGTSVSLHRHGRVIDVNDSLGGDGPMSMHRAGTVPAFPLVEMCFSGKYSKNQVRKMLVGEGGAVAYLGTNDFRVIAKMLEEGDEKAALFVKAYCAGIAKYIGYFAPVVCGKVDAVILTGGIAHNKAVVDAVSEMVRFIAPVYVYPGENEMVSLAENGYGVLSGEFEVRSYTPWE